MPDGDGLTVTAVVPDEIIGAAEVVISQATGSSLGVVTPRYLLISYEGDRLAVEAAVRSSFGGLPVRLRAPGETPFLRYGDAVLPQSLIKAQFGEFAYRMLDERSFEPDPGWVAENIVTTELPLLGQVTCHRSVVPLVHNAMAEMKKRDLESLVDPEEFAGCWNPRLIARGQGHLPPRLGRRARHQLGGKSHRDRLRSGPPPGRCHGQAGFHLGWSLANPRPRPLRVGRRALP